MMPLFFCKKNTNGNNEKFSFRNDKLCIKLHNDLPTLNCGILFLINAIMSKGVQVNCYWSGSVTTCHKHLPHGYILLSISQAQLMTINIQGPGQRLQVKQHRLQPNPVAGSQSHSGLQYILPRWLKRIWACLNITTIFSGMGIPIMKIKQSWDHCIFITRIPTLVRHHFYMVTLSTL